MDFESFLINVTYIGKGESKRVIHTLQMLSILLRRLIDNNYNDSKQIFLVSFTFLTIIMILIKLHKTLLILGKHGLI